MTATTTAGAPGDTGRDIALGVVGFVRRWPMLVVPAAVLVGLYVVVPTFEIPEVAAPPLLAPQPAASAPSVASVSPGAVAPSPPPDAPAPPASPAPTLAPAPPLPVPPDAPPATPGPGGPQPVAGRIEYAGTLVESVDPGIAYHEAAEAIGEVRERSRERFEWTLTAGDHVEGRLFDRERVLGFSLTFGPTGTDVAVDAVCDGGFPLLPTQETVTTECVAPNATVRVVTQRIETTDRTAKVHREYHFSGDVSGSRLVEEDIALATGLVEAWVADGTYEVTTGLPFSAARYLESARMARR